MIFDSLTSQLTLLWHVVANPHPDKWLNLSKNNSLSISENVFDDYDYEDLTGSELFEALVETFKELENDLKEELKPIQYVLNKLDPEDSEPQVLNG